MNDEQLIWESYKKIIKENNNKFPFRFIGGVVNDWNNSQLDFQMLSKNIVENLRLVDNEAPKLISNEVYECAVLIDVNNKPLNYTTYCSNNKSNLENFLDDRCESLYDAMHGESNFTYVTLDMYSPNLERDLSELQEDLHRL